MIDHYTYPSRAELAAESRATDRDDADLATLHTLADIVRDAISRVRELDSLRHPEGRWNGDDLLINLRLELANIEGERKRITDGPLVLDAEDV
jgi:hypothetical protein